MARADAPILSGLRVETSTTRRLLLMSVAMFLIVAHVRRERRFLIRCNAMEPEVTFPANWSAPYELTRALPREVERTGRGTFMVVMAAIFMLATIPFFLIIHNQRQKQVTRIESLRERGRDTTATVARLYHEGKSSTPMVEYTFDAGVSRVKGQASTPSAVWHALQVGNPLPVRFLAEDPSVNHPSGWTEQPLPVGFEFAIPVLFLLVGGLFAWDVRAEASLLENGVPAPAVVTKCSRTKGGYVVRYRFRMKDGTPHKGASQLPQRQEPGAPLLALYDPEKPRRNKTYPLRLYRLRS